MSVDSTAVKIVAFVQRECSCADVSIAVVTENYCAAVAAFGVVAVEIGVPDCYGRCISVDRAAALSSVVVVELDVSEAD